MIDRVALNTYVMSGSAALVLTFIEPFRHFGAGLSTGEKAFRLGFVALYALLVAVAVLGFRSAEGVDAGLSNDQVKALCAVASLLGLVFAAAHRRRRPLALALSAPRPSPRLASDLDRLTAERLMRLITEEAVFTQPELRIGTVAARLQMPEHQVSQGRENRLRIHLTDPDNRRSILQIAFDCGFASLGPFNRAFRAQHAMTPSQYRSQMRPIDRQRSARRRTLAIWHYNANICQMAGTDRMSHITLVDTQAQDFRPEPITDEEAAAMFRAVVRLFAHWGLTDDQAA
ncbi:hypothetical protein LTR94_024600, partial [Friedmanniomyces endolithicus]